jgi:hypothetical protein
MLPLQAETSTATRMMQTNQEPVIQRTPKEHRRASKKTMIGRSREPQLVRLPLQPRSLMSEMRKGPKTTRRRKGRKKRRRWMLRRDGSLSSGSAWPR